MSTREVPDDDAETLPSQTPDFLVGWRAPEMDN
jgi:hypothetical protein